MEKKEILELIEIFNSKGLTEFSIENGDFSMTLKKEPAPINISQAAYSPSLFAAKTGESVFGLEELGAYGAAGSAAYRNAAGAGAGVENTEYVNAAGSRGAAGSSAAAARADKSLDEACMIKAPLVGVFYEAPAPAEEPFVRIGDIAEKGQTLCLIEAMKMINELKATDRIRIKDIKVSNGDMVEFGQLIFEVEKC